MLNVLVPDIGKRLQSPEELMRDKLARLCRFLIAFKSYQTNMD
jgi:hypothetical protein